MRMHDLKSPAGARHRKRRLGRGISAGQGKTAGKGTKGQLARSGPGLPGWFEGGQTPIHMRVPKLRGFKNQFRIAYTPVNLDRLAAGAKDGAVTPESLAEKGLVPQGSRIKVLGDGEVTAPLRVSTHAASAQARKKIEAAGGSITLIGGAAEKQGEGEEQKS